MATVLQLPTGAQPKNALHRVFELLPALREFHYVVWRPSRGGGSDGAAVANPWVTDGETLWKMAHDYGVVSLDMILSGFCARPPVSAPPPEASLEMGWLGALRAPIFPGAEFELAFPGSSTAVAVGLPQEILDPLLEAWSQ
jgi:hypothetical protein